MIASYSRVTVRAGDRDAYLVARRDEINPVLETQAGFRGSELLEPTEPESSDTIRFGLFNYWESPEHAARWAKAKIHDAVSQVVIPLVLDLETRRLEVITDASVAKMREGVQIARVSLQHVKSEGLTDYLEYRKAVINPSMASAPGFGSATVMRSISDPTEFLLYFRWRSEAAAEEYFNSPEHLGGITDRVFGLLEGPPERTKYAVVELS